MSMRTQLVGEDMWQTVPVPVESVHVYRSPKMDFIDEKMKHVSYHMLLVAKLLRPLTNIYQFLKERPNILGMSRI